MPVRLSSGNSKLILLGRRQGGRRYLGEDLNALARAAAEIAARVEALRREELYRLVSQAELARCRRRRIRTSCSTPSTRSMAPSPRRFSGAAHRAQSRRDLPGVTRKMNPSLAVI